MTNLMDFEKISLIVSTLIAVFMAYLYWRELKLKKDKAPTENALNVSMAVKNLSEALGMQTDELAEALKDSAQLRADLTKAKVETALRIAETAKHRQETDEKIEALNREYLKETQRLRDENTNLQKQVNELQLQYSEIDKKYGNSKLIIERLVKALKDANIPLPDLGDVLSDSIHSWKWPK
jgi:chromosome segregation ATPase